MTTLRNNNVFKSITLKILMTHSTKEIAYGEVKVRDIKDGTKLLWIRHQNSIALAVDWCEKYNFRWLSLPESLDVTGYNALRSILPGINEVHFQRLPICGSGPFGSEERVTSEARFNSHLLLDESGTKFELFHQLPYSARDLADCFQSAYLSPKLDLSKLERVQKMDITNRLYSTGWNGIPWMETYLDNPKGELEENLLGAKNSTEVIAGSPHWSLGRVQLTTSYPTSKTRIFPIGMTNEPRLGARGFFHGSEEFADYFLVSNSTK